MVQPKGWHSRGYLPHFDSAETIQFVTFRLADSLPWAIVDRLRASEAALHEIDRELDAGRGACWLKRPDVASVVENALLHFDGERYRLLGWCLMPNHVHVVAEILEGHSLSAIVGSWKSFTSKKANALLVQSGRFWEADYFDRFMRNEEHLSRTVEYIEQNPVAAGLIACASDWLWSSARLRTHERAGGPRSE